MCFYPLNAGLLVHQQGPSYGFKRLPLTAFRRRSSQRGQRGTSAFPKPRLMPPPRPRSDFPAGGSRAAAGPRRDGAASPVRSAPRTLLVADLPPLSALRREKTAASLPGFISTPLASGSQGVIAAGRRGHSPGPERGAPSRAGHGAALGARCKPWPGGVSGGAAREPRGAAPSASAAASPRPSPITATATQPALPLPAGREEAGFKHKHRSAARWIIFALVWCLICTLGPPHSGGT